MVVSGVLRRYQAKIQVLTLMDSEASGYAFIGQDFAHQHSFSLYSSNIHVDYLGLMDDLLEPVTSLM